MIRETRSIDVVCPSCGAQPGDRCMVDAPLRLMGATGYHAPRVTAAARVTRDVNVQAKQKAEAP